MFSSCDKVVLLLEVMHLTKVKSDLISASMREMQLECRQTLGYNVRAVWAAVRPVDSLLFLSLYVFL